MPPAISEMSRAAKEYTKILRQQVDRKELREALDWISPTWYQDKYADLLGSRTERTGSWFVEHVGFRKWLDCKETSSCLICQGDPGTGKTTIAATTIQHIRTTAEPAVVAYILCDYKTDKDMHVTDYLASLLKQLASQDADMAKPLLDLHDKKSNNRVELKKEDIQKALADTIAKTKRVYIILDALDECRDDVSRDLVDSIAELAHRPGKARHSV